MCEYWHRTLKLWVVRSKAPQNRSRRNVWQLIKLIAKKINMLISRRAEKPKRKKWKEQQKAKAESKNQNQLGKQWQITNYAIDMAIIIIIIIMHIQGPRRKLSWYLKWDACATVFIWFWNWVLVCVFFFLYFLLVVAACLYSWKRII